MEQIISIMQSMLQGLPAWVIALVMALFFLSEALSYIKSIKANGVFQAVYNILKAVLTKMGKISTQIFFLLR